MRIYIVFGTTGEYSDRSRWMVKAFTSEAKAQELVTKAETRARVLQVEHDCDPPQGSNEFDPNMSMDYTGTHYHYGKVELEAA